MEILMYFHLKAHVLFDLCRAYKFEQQRNVKCKNTIELNNYLKDQERFEDPN